MSGKVTLVGAGPGGVGLMTVRGLRALEAAEVVVYDRLVDEEILARIPADAERIDVGKRAANHPVPQPEINRLLLQRALEGKNVVRLKGGDSFLFGRGGEELELLAENEIEFEVVPGITSALAAPSCAGIPVTHRDYCASVHIIAGHRRGDGALSLDYDALRRAGGTLVFLMSVATFGEIAGGLMRAGFAADFPCAIVENGARPEQRRLATTLGGAAACIAREGVRSPAVFVVGRVCELADRFDWFGRLPMRGRRVLAAPDAAYLSERLRELGARVTDMPVPKVKWLPFELPRPGGALLLDGVTAVEALFARLDALQLDARALAGCRLICPPAAARALRSHGLRADEVVEDWPEDVGSAILLCEEEEARGESPRVGADAIVGNGSEDTDSEISLYGKEETQGESTYTGVAAAASDLPEEAGSAILLCEKEEVRRRSLYPAGADANFPRLRAAWREEVAPVEPGVEFVVCLSRRDLVRFARAAKDWDVSRVQVVCADPAIARAAQALGLRASVPGQPTVEGVIALCESLCRADRVE